MWKQILHFSTELAFPKECFFCRTSGTWLCQNCLSLLDIGQTRCPFPAKQTKINLYSACSYSNPFIQKLLRNFKYEPFAKCLAKPFAEIIATHLKLLEPQPDFSDFFLMAVPLGPKRMRWRGFNQSEEIAKELSKILNVEILRSCLIRTKDTLPQSTSNLQERFSSMKNAFACINENARGKKILLVDDVITTGATTKECVHVLGRFGAKEIAVLTVARTE